MKWIYRILRLFLCPHKFIIISSVHVFNQSDQQKGVLYGTQCRYCGKIKEYKVSV